MTRAATGVRAVEILAMSVAGFLGLWIGFIDSMTAVLLGARVVGTILFLAGFVVIVSLAQMVWRPEKASETRGCVVASLIGLVFLLAQFAGMAIDWKILIWLFLVTVPLARVTYLLSSVASRRFSKIIKTALSAASFAALGGVFQFWYTTQYFPTTSQALNMRVELTSEKPYDKCVPEMDSPVVLKITRTNVGSFRGTYVGSLLTVYGARKVVRPNGLEVHPLSVDSGAERGRLENRFFETPVLELIEVRTPFVRSGRFIDPKRQYRDSFVTFVPADQYDYLVLTARIDYANGSRLRLETVQPRIQEFHIKNGSQLRIWRSTWRIVESSKLSAITRGKRFINSDLSIQGDGIPSLTTYVTEASGRSSHWPWDDSDLSQLYGVGSTSESSDLPFQDVNRCTRALTD